jgi:hypothetical protein
MAILGIGFTWPILLIFIAPIIAAGILARTGINFSVQRALCILASIYPIAWLALIYWMWVIAWRVRGRHPSPGNDDPAHISEFVSELDGIAGVMFFGLPIAFLLGLISLMLAVDSRSPSIKSALSGGNLALIAIWIAFGLWWVGDPGQAIEWFFD